MQPFAWQRADSLADAAQAATAAAGASFIAGGTTLADLMRLEVMAPHRLVDINGLRDRGCGEIVLSHGWLQLGALVRMADAAAHPLLRARFPVLAEALALAASPQLRNMASLGGNLLQRTRCDYFRDRGWGCNRREPGTGCAAMHAPDRKHAVLGGSASCIATYPGDFAPALVALDAMLRIYGPDGHRVLPAAELHRLPGDRPELETNLRPGELIARIDVPAGPWTRRSRFVKVRDRASYAFALASAAVALELDGMQVRQARIGLGGVATVPWRAWEAEQALQGRRLDKDAARAAAAAAFAGAQPGRHNRFKLALGQEVLVRALLEARDMDPPQPEGDAEGSER